MWGPKIAKLVHNYSFTMIGIGYNIAARLGSALQRPPAAQQLLGGLPGLGHAARAGARATAQTQLQGAQQHLEVFEKRRKNLGKYPGK